MPGDHDATPLVSVVAVIPARGGSKGIPGKNLRPVGGVSLIGRSVRSCRRSELVDAVFVSTDDAEIAAEATRFGALIVDRPGDLAGDLASSESALLHALDEIERDGIAVDVLVFVQCTSPFIEVDALDRAIAKVTGGSADAVFSASETYEFLWRAGGDGLASGVNHDHRTRPRRQDRAPDLRETGAFYVMRAEGFRATRHRFFGRIAAEPVSELSGFEVDEPDDLRLVEAIAPLVDAPPAAARPVKQLAALVMDFDGVHTDDRVWVREDGMEMAAANRSDGHGVKLLREAGWKLLILSTEVNPIVAHRARKLGVECRHAIGDKLAELRRWAAEQDLDLDRVAYIGNDVNDDECMRAVGFPVAVADAHPQILRRAVHVTTRAGGAGAVREVAELLLRG